jgi:hypothetical protein
MSNKSNSTVTAMGIDIGKNSFHVVGLDQRGAIVLRQTWSRGQVEVRLANMPRCLIGMEVCVGAHYLSRKLQAHGHDVRLMPSKYVLPFAGQLVTIVGHIEHAGIRHLIIRTADKTGFLLPSWMTTPEAGATQIVPGAAPCCRIKSDPPAARILSSQRDRRPR